MNYLNNYKFQIGTKPAKYFKSPDYKYLARKYKLLDREILAVERGVVMDYRDHEEGFEWSDEF